MKKIFLLTILSSLSFFAGAQNDTLNKFDSKGKKNGTWTQYYDARLKEVKDSSKASYFRYTYFDHGRDLLMMDFTGKKNWGLAHSWTTELQKGNSKILNGEYYWTDKKGIVRERNNFKDGYLTMQRFYYPSGDLQWDWDFLTQVDGQPYTYVVYYYDKKGIVTHCYEQEKTGTHWNLLDCGDIILLNINTFSTLDIPDGSMAVDVKGKKNGTMREYYDLNLNKVKDSTKAFYYWNKQYINGFCLSWFAPPFDGFKLSHKEESNMQSGKINALNGTYTWKDKNGTIRLIDEFKDGYSVLYERFEPDGKLSYIRHFDKKYKDHAYTELTENYNRDGTIEQDRWMYQYLGARLP